MSNYVCIYVCMQHLQDVVSLHILYLLPGINARIAERSRNRIGYAGYVNHPVNQAALVIQPLTKV